MQQPQASQPSGVEHPKLPQPVSIPENSSAQARLLQLSASQTGSSQLQLQVGQANGSQPLRLQPLNYLSGVSLQPRLVPLQASGNERSTQQQQPTASLSSGSGQMHSLAQNVPSHGYKKVNIIG